MQPDNTLRPSPLAWRLSGELHAAGFRASALVVERRVKLNGIDLAALHRWAVGTGPEVAPLQDALLAWPGEWPEGPLMRALKAELDPATDGR